MSEKMRFACGHGHAITAELTWADGAEQDLTGHFCPVCLGQVVGFENEVDGRILAPMQPRYGAQEE